jgi:8-oxo-dGTP pyrophosphatase MutT (NUDIX family)
MLQMYKVFVNDKVIYFTNNVENCGQLTKGLTLTFFSEKITSYLVDFIFNDDKVEHIVIAVSDYETAFTVFQKYFKIIEAAGGIVSNDKDEKLFIYRLDKWDFPKGKIEEEENVEEAALREIEEECGVNQLIIKKSLEDTFHLYKFKGDIVFKRTYWFETVSSFSGELVPQLEEDITNVEWLSDTQIEEKVLGNTYASIKTLLNSSI